MDGVLRSISIKAAEVSISTGEEEAKATAKKSIEKAKARLRKIAGSVLDNVQSVTEPLKHSEHASLRRIATKIEDLKTENDEKVSEAECKAAKQTLKAKLFKHGRRLSTGIALASTAARALLTPEAVEASEALTPAAKTFETLIASTRDLKDAGKVLGELTTAASQATLRASSAVSSLKTAFSEDFLTPGLFSPRSTQSSQTYATPRSEGDPGATPVSIAEFLSPLPPPESFRPSLVPKEGMLERYATSTLVEEAKTGVYRRAKERFLSGAEEAFKDVEEKILGGETAEAVKTIVEHHTSQAIDAASSKLASAAHRISAFCRKTLE